MALLKIFPTGRVKNTNEKGRNWVGAPGRAAEACKGRTMPSDRDQRPAISQAPNLSEEDQPLAWWLHPPRLGPLCCGVCSPCQPNCGARSLAGRACDSPPRGSVTL